MRRGSSIASRASANPGSCAVAERALPEARPRRARCRGHASAGGSPRPVDARSHAHRHLAKTASRGARLCRCRRCGSRSPGRWPRRSPPRRRRSRGRGTTCRPGSRPSGEDPPAATASAPDAAPRAANVRRRAPHGSPSAPTRTSRVQARASRRPSRSTRPRPSRPRSRAQCLQAPGRAAASRASIGSNRSPCSFTRSSATSIEKSRGLTSSVSSSHRSGVDTGAPGFGRTE